MLAGASVGSHVYTDVHQHPRYHIYLAYRNMRNTCYGIVFAQHIKGISYNEQFTVSPHVGMMF